MGPWYHGSPLELTVLRAGSTVTQDRDLARIFSHKPSLVVITDEGDIRHSGNEPGFLYLLDEVVGSEDVDPHPTTTMRPGDEWLTRREFRLRRLETTTARPDELLSEVEVAELHRRMAAMRDPGQGTTNHPDRLPLNT